MKEYFGWDSWLRQQDKSKMANNGSNTNEVQKLEAIRTSKDSKFRKAKIQRIDITWKIERKKKSFKPVKISVNDDLQSIK